MGKKNTADKFLPVLGFLVLAMLAGDAVLQFFVNLDKDRDTAQAQLSEQQALAYGVSASTLRALQGEAAAFDELTRLVGDGKAAASELAMSGDAVPAQARIVKAWSAIDTDVSAIADARQPILDGRGAAEKMAETMPQLLAEVDALEALLTPAQQEAAARQLERFGLEAQGVSQAMTALVSGGGNADEIAQRLPSADDYLGQVLRGFASGDAALGIAALTGDEVVAKLGDVQSLYAAVSDQVRMGIYAAESLVTARAAGERVLDAAGTITGDTRSVGGTLNSASTGVDAAWPLWLVLAALVLLVVTGVVYRLSTGSRKQAREHKEKNDRNQAAILRLLDEMGSLADGDLTVEATVTEDITGAIADSINYAIDRLRELVTTIDSTASNVDAAARDTQASAAHLAQASENQSRQVQAATESIANMAESIEEVSGNAERSADVARHSVEVAHKGGEAVRRTIDGMNTIRETIQETSKRIKRLGESSQEIGNIVELINDIAEQTNILALNASIQASMAGDAGRGFAVVADEVQRLAERSANATKQIEVLVKTIQSDTNEAVVSMERSTTDVVSGALLAENAGSSLDEIEKVSNQIANLVQNISGTARQQATAAADMTRNMGVLQEISSQTADSTTATSDSIGKLADMATELRKLVDSFTLPSDEDAKPLIAVSSPPVLDEAVPVEMDKAS
ncbi:MAG: methyl-accepting chemotaxis protein [Pseudomonadota bacterium]